MNQIQKTSRKDTFFHLICDNVSNKKQNEERRRTKKVYELPPVDKLNGCYGSAFAPVMTINKKNVRLCERKEALSTSSEFYYLIYPAELSCRCFKKSSNHSINLHCNKIPDKYAETWAKSLTKLNFNWSSFRAAVFVFLQKRLHFYENSQRFTFFVSRSQLQSRKNSLKH